MNTTSWEDTRLPFKMLENCLHLSITFKSTSWTSFNTKLMTGVGPHMLLRVYGNGSLVFWVVSYQRNIAGFSSDNYGGFFCHVGGKAFSFSNCSSQTAPLTVSRDPTNTRDMSAYFRNKFALFHYTDFYLLVDLYKDVQMICKICYFCLWVDSKLHCYQCYWVVHSISFPFYLSNSLSGMLRSVSYFMQCFIAVMKLFWFFYIIKEINWNICGPLMRHNHFWVMCGENSTVNLIIEKCLIIHSSKIKLEHSSATEIAGFNELWIRYKDKIYSIIASGARTSSNMSLLLLWVVSMSWYHNIPMGRRKKKMKHKLGRNLKKIKNKNKMPSVFPAANCESWKRRDQEYKLFCGMTELIIYEISKLLFATYLLKDVNIC